MITTAANTQTKGAAMDTTKKDRLIQEILMVCKANDTPVTGDLFLALAFRTEAELIKIAAELYIVIK